MSHDMSVKSAVKLVHKATAEERYALALHGAAVLVGDCDVTIRPYKDALKVLVSRYKEITRRALTGDQRG